MKFEKESRMEDKGNVIKLPPFNGRKKKFPLWWSKFEAACNVKGCAETEILDMSTDEGEAFKKIKVKKHWRCVILS